MLKILLDFLCTRLCRGGPKITLSFQDSPGGLTGIGILTVDGYKPKSAKEETRGVWGDQGRPDVSSLPVAQAGQADPCQDQVVVTLWRLPSRKAHEGLRVPCFCGRQVTDTASARHVLESQTSRRKRIQQNPYLIVPTLIRALGALTRAKSQTPLWGHSCSRLSRGSCPGCYGNFCAESYELG